ncbi:hypothetical protein [Kangiella sp. HZ709]|uniref:hypothetical protein n=1 Tax=Kangiella sp. HZ709 TaxID=2666328 RepID=UPI0012AFE791|nr:hypothetical protein [Kangiella sp. HZ709]MRX27590.1 hypothetical protein [Kangiella sp. HZ709]
MKVLLSTVLLVVTACSNEPKESDKLISDYKKQQMQKAQQIEDEMNKRLDNLERQLEDIEKKKKDDPQ